MLVTGLLPSVAAPLTTIRMCPAITTRNWQQYSPLLAGGTTGGLIQVYNLATGNIEKELVIHSYTVRWVLNGDCWLLTQLIFFFLFFRRSLLGSSERKDMQNWTNSTNSSNKTFLIIFLGESSGQALRHSFHTPTQTHQEPPQTWETSCIGRTSSAASPAHCARTKLKKLRLRSSAFLPSSSILF